MHSVAVLFAAFASLLSLVCAHSAGNKVVLLSDSDLSAYSRLSQVLQENAFKVEKPELSSFELFRYGERTVDHAIVLLNDLKKWPSKLGASQWVDFIKRGGNVLLASDSASTAVRQLGSELGLNFDVAGDRLKDVATGSSDEVLTSVLASVPIVDKANVPIAFRGFGVALSGDNPLVMAVLRAPSTAVSVDSKGKVLATGATGEDAVVVAALQARNNARVLFSASASLFSDAFWEKSSNGKTANGAAVKQLLAWITQERCVLRTKHVEHKLVGGNASMPESYRIKDTVVGHCHFDLSDMQQYDLDVEEKKDGKWVPFKLPKGDKIQVALTMLDPWVRQDLVMTAPGHYSAQFRVPDQHGVFTMSVEYKRYGWTYLSVKHKVSALPFRHDAYPRFLSAAYPYYAVMGSMIVAWIVFSVVYLFAGEPKGKAKQQ